MGEYLISPTLGGSVATYTSSGAIVALDVSLLSGASLGQLTGSVYNLGLDNFEIIRKNSGSPAVNYVFSSLPNSFLLQNLGSAPVYFTFNNTADVTASGTAFLQANDGMSFDLRIGSVSVQSSGLTSSSVQVLRIS